MKYGYETDEDLIAGYYFVDKFIVDDIILDNQIIVVYLDGTADNMPYSKEYEKKILNKMLNQAIERSKCTYLLDYEKKRRIFSVLSMMFGTGFALLNYISAKNGKYIDMYQTLNFVNFANIITDLFLYKNSNEKINELEKYDIYLSIKETIESLPIILQETIGCNNLNINLLDSYTLKEIRKMKKELDKIEIDKEMLKKYKEEKSLSLKNRKENNNS